jgi:hypothetical protein
MNSYTRKASVTEGPHPLPIVFVLHKPKDWSCCFWRHKVLEKCSLSVDDIRAFPVLNFFLGYIKGLQSGSRISGSWILQSKFISPNLSFILVPNNPVYCNCKHESVSTFFVRHSTQERTLGLRRVLRKHLKASNLPIIIPKRNINRQNIFRFQLKVT